MRDGRACCPVRPKQLVICRFLRFQRRRHVGCFKSLFMCTGTGCIEILTEWKPCKRVRARTYVSCACLAHGLQCLRDRRACCPVLPKQLVICRFLRFQRRRHVGCFNLLLHWTGTAWFEIPTEWKTCKLVRARAYASCACLAHSLQCLRDGRACCPSLLKKLVICRVLEVSPAPSRCRFNSLLHWTGRCWFEFPT